MRRPVFTTLAGAVFLLLFASLLASVFEGQSQAGQGRQTTSIKIVCKPHYVRAGRLCCLDLDEDSVCDKDKTPQTTSTLSASSSTTTTIPKNQAPLPVACAENSDCGMRREKRVCYNSDVYLILESPFCEKPGTTYSRCVIKTSGLHDPLGNPTPVDVCGGGCVNATCT